MLLPGCEAMGYQLQTASQSSFLREGLLSIVHGKGTQDAQIM